MIECDSEILNRCWDRDDEMVPLPFLSTPSLCSQGFGFIDMAGQTLFVHFSECEVGKQPKEGDILTFQYEPRRGEVWALKRGRNSKLYFLYLFMFTGRLRFF